MNTCPCCSERLLRHARHNRVYWFCPHCRQEMPNFSDIDFSGQSTHVVGLANVMEASSFAASALDAY